MKFNIKLKKIQHIDSLEYEIDLTENKLHCIVGKNGIGKTTFIKSIQNFKETNTLDKTSRLNIIKEDSKLVYTLEEKIFKFNPIRDENRFILDSNNPIKEEEANLIYTEFPIPYGKRFNFYSRLGDLKEDIAQKFATSDYSTKPTELISILNYIYNDSRFDSLECVTIKNENFYLLPLSEDTYIREDDFSSGEYMLIQVYKLIKSESKLIVIDELDISLDSSAQVNLITKLRELVSQSDINILFTTHSLAIMKTMNDDELYYMEILGNETTITNKSYSYIKHALFGFKGYDRIILTEDKMIVKYLNTFIPKSIPLKVLTIDVSGHAETVKIMDKNKEEHFLGTDNVLTILDGDTRSMPNYQGRMDIKFIPYDSIEKELFKEYELGNLNELITSGINNDSITNARGIGKKSKALYNEMIDRGYLNFYKVIILIESKFQQESQSFKYEINEFLS
ncbi:MAG: AAA family ATPase [Campylobacterota bacterium]